MRVLTDESARILDSLRELAGSSEKLQNAFRTAREENPEEPVPLGTLIDLLTSSTAPPSEAEGKSPESLPPR